MLNLAFFVLSSHYTFQGAFDEDDFWITNEIVKDVLVICLIICTILDWFLLFCIINLLGLHFFLIKKGITTFTYIIGRREKMAQKKKEKEAKRLLKHKKKQEKLMK